MVSSRLFALAGGMVLSLVLSGASSGAGAAPITFATPVDVSKTAVFQAAEPSIRVDASDPNHRIWIAAPQGIGIRHLPEGDGGDLVWYSDDNGLTWTFQEGPGGTGSPTVIGGGDSDLATGFADEVYVTGLTLANITLAASCDNGATFTFNPITVPSTPDDRQWMDAYEDSPLPAGAPQFVLNYGNFAAGRMLYNQILAPACAPPVGGPDIDVSGPGCTTGTEIDCYQWPGNLAVDENTGDVYVTHNTLGNPNNDDVIVARVDGGASSVPATQADVFKFVAANNRPDTFDSFTAVAVDRASNVYVVWSERHSATQTTETRFAVSKDRGVTWSPAFKVNKAPLTTTFPWIVAGGAGKIDIVYYGTSATGPSPETVPLSSRWKVYMAQSVNALSATPKFVEKAATGFMHEGSICTSGTGCAAGTRDLLDFFQIDIDQHGLANIAYTDNLNTPPSGGSDLHQEHIFFVQQKTGRGLN
jgi:hypothetical protein